jgi:hypothetical protein
MLETIRMQRKIAHAAVWVQAIISGTDHVGGALFALGLGALAVTFN